MFFSFCFLPPSNVFIAIARLQRRWECVGLLDITKVFHEALGKVERSSAASEQLFTAMAGVQSELGAVGSNLKLPPCLLGPKNFVKKQPYLI
jgi:hypothetical protein